MQLHGMELQEQGTTPLQIALAPLTPRERAQLALALDVDAVTVWRWAKGKSTPQTQESREAVARELRQKTDELFPEDGSPSEAPAA